MKHISPKELLTALEQEMVAAGFPNRQKTKKLMRSLSRGKAPKHTSFGDAVLAGLALGIHVHAKKHKFKNEAEKQRYLEHLKGARYQMRTALIKTLRIAKDATPRRGGPGRHPKLNDYEKKTICNLIGSFITSGMTVTFAIEQASKEKKVSKRTAWKVWNERGSR